MSRLYNLENTEPEFLQYNLANNSDYKTYFDRRENATNSNREETNRKMAAGASVIGQLLSFIPNPATRAIGYLLQAPDFGYDLYDIINADTAEDRTNAGIHTALDALGFTPYKYSGVSTIDDIFSYFGRDLIIDPLQAKYMEKMEQRQLDNEQFARSKIMKDLTSSNTKKNVPIARKDNTNNKKQINIDRNRSLKNKKNNKK